MITWGLNLCSSQFSQRHPGLLGPQRYRRRWAKLAKIAWQNHDARDWCCKWLHTHLYLCIYIYACVCVCVLWDIMLYTYIYIYIYVGGYSGHGCFLPITGEFQTGLPLIPSHNNPMEPTQKNGGLVNLRHLPKKWRVFSENTKNPSHLWPLGLTGIPVLSVESHHHFVDWSPTSPVEYRVKTVKSDGQFQILSWFCRPQSSSSLKPHGPQESRWIHTTKF